MMTKRPRTYPTTLKGAERYRVTEERTTDTARDDLIGRANEVADLRLILNEMGCHIPEGRTTSWKARCPYGEEHSDGGKDKAMRYYSGTNSAYCFALHGVFTPVSLMAQEWECTFEQAAKRLLEQHGISLAQNYRQRFAEIAAEREKAESSGVDVQFALEALQVYLQGSQTYRERQYDADVREVMEQIMADLDECGHDDLAGLDSWLKRSKGRMQELLGG